MGDYEDVGGAFELQVNGVVYNLKGQPTIEMGGVIREPILGPRGQLHGYKVIGTNPAKISGTITDTSALDIVELQQTKDATVTLQKPNGKKVVMEHACFSVIASESGEEGEVSFEFQGPPASEQKS